MTAAWYRNNFNKQTHLLMASSSLNTKLPVSEDVTCDQLGHTYLPPPPIMTLNMKMTSIQLQEGMLHHLLENKLKHRPLNKEGKSEPLKQ